MHCYVYKGVNKQDHFLYLAREFDASDLPVGLPRPLLDLLGDLDLVIDFDLLETRKLPNADAKEVINALNEKGYYFQMPRETMFDAEERFFN